MFSIICLFAWLPYHYNFRAAIMSVFNITAGQLVSIRKKRRHNIVIFTVASQEIFNTLSEFYCRILLFPILGHNILECFAYPKSPQYQFLSVSGNFDWITAGTQIRNLPGLGTVLYHCHLIDSAPLTSGFRTDRIGMVLRRRNETNDSVVRAANHHSRQRRRGNGQELQPGVPNVLAVGLRRGLQQLFRMPGCLHYFGNVPLQSVFLYQHEGLQIISFEDNLERANNCIRRCRGGSGHGIRSSWIGLFYPVETPRAILAPQEPSSEDERPTDTPTAEDQNPESLSVFPYQHEGLQIIAFEGNVEGPYNWNIRRCRSRSGHEIRSSWMRLFYPAEAPRAILAPQGPSSEDERPSETPTAEDQNPESLSDKQE